MNCISQTDATNVVNGMLENVSLGILSLVKTFDGWEAKLAIVGAEQLDLSGIGKIDIDCQGALKQASSAGECVDEATALGSANRALAQLKIFAAQANPLIRPGGDFNDPGAWHILLGLKSTGDCKPSLSTTDLDLFVNCRGEISCE